MPRIKRNPKRKTLELEKAGGKCMKMSHFLVKENNSGAVIISTATASRLSSIHPTNTTETDIPASSVCHTDTTQIEIPASSVCPAAKIIQTETKKLALIVRQRKTIKIPASFASSGTRGKKISSYYKGVQLNVDNMITKYSDLEKYVAMKNSKMCVHIVCKLCREYIEEAKKYSKNGVVPIASGVRVDGEVRLKLVVDHLQSEVHYATATRRQLQLNGRRVATSIPGLRY